MSEAIERYWRIRLTHLKKALEGNDFEVFIAENKIEAKEIVLGHILPQTGARSVSRGGSMTVIATGIWEAMKDHPDLEFIEPFEKVLTPEGREQRMERMRQSLLVDIPNRLLENRRTRV